MRGLKRGGSRRTTEKKPVKRTPMGAQIILVPLDFSEASRSALRYAQSLVRQFGGKLILFYALEPVATPDFAYHPLMMQPRDASAQAEQRLRKMGAQEGIDPKFIANIVVRRGTAHAEIARAAERMSADLIVIATHGHTGLKHVLLGSTTERVVRHARCPVLVVRD